MATTREIILITGASSGFDALTARALAWAGQVVYASMLDIHGSNAGKIENVQKFADERKVDLRAVELDVTSQPSADAALKTILDAEGRLDVVIHNASPMVFGPAEAFTPEQFAHPGG